MSNNCIKLNVFNNKKCASWEYCWLNSWTPEQLLFYTAPDILNIYSSTCSNEQCSTTTVQQTTIPVVYKHM